MRKDGYAEGTIEATSRKLLRIAHAVDLQDHETVKEYVASKNGKASYMEGFADAYDRYFIATPWS